MNFFFNDTATTEIYTLSLHDALPISHWRADEAAPGGHHHGAADRPGVWRAAGHVLRGAACRSEEHTSELQSRQYLVCRLLLEKKKIEHTPLASTDAHQPHAVSLPIRG